MKRLLIISVLLIFACWIYATCLHAAVPTFESFPTNQYQTNGLQIYYRAVHTNDAGIIYPSLDNSLSLITNLNAYGTFSLPSKVTILALGTNYLDVSTNSTWLLNSPTNDATQVILSLSAGQYQGQLAFITSQNGSNTFTLPDLSEQWDVPGAYVDIQGDWIGTTNRGIILQYTAPDWIEMARFDPAQSGGGTVLGSGTINYLPQWTTATQLGDSPLYAGNKYTITLISTNNNVPVFSIQPANTNVSSASWIIKHTDSDGQADSVWLNGVKNTGWDLGTPSARDSTFSVNVQHDNAMANRLQISGLGPVSFIDRDGINTLVEITTLGGVVIGTAPTWWGDFGPSFLMFANTNHGSTGNWELFAGGGGDVAGDNYNFDTYGDERQVNTISGSTTNYVNIYANNSSTDNAGIEISTTGGKKTFITPAIASGSSSTAYYFDTASSLAATESLLKVLNHGTNKFSVSNLGAIIIAGTTNQVTFGATNTAPVSAVAPTKWISVKVAGDSGVYRIPLYE